MDGTEIPQLYLGFPKFAKEPPRVLKGFQKVDLKVRESKTVTFNLSYEDFSTWDVYSHAWQPAMGDFQFFVGSSSRDSRISQKCNLDGIHVLCYQFSDE